MLTINWGAMAPLIAIALITSIIGIKVLRRHAVRWNLIDQPGGRKAHERPTPTIGGLAIMLGFAVALGMSAFSAQVTIDLLAYWPLWLSLLLMAGIGLMDDRRGVSSRPKLLVQVLVGAVVIFAGDVVLRDLGVWPSGQALTLGIAAIPVTWLGIVGFINALNMMDGVDGLAGGCVFVMLGWLAVAAGLGGALASAQIGLLLGAAVVGFLLHNMRSPLRRRASVFLGDTGSLVLGLAVIWLGIEVAQAPNREVSPIGIAWVLVLPVLDTLSLIIRRLLRGQNPFQADRNHLHHILGRAGFSPGQSAAILVGLSFGFGAVGVVGSAIGVPDVVLAVALFAVASLHYLFVRYAWRSTRALRRLRASGIRLKAADRTALIGLYIGVLGVALALQNLALIGLVLVGLASLWRMSGMWADLRHVPAAGWAVALLVWLSVAAWRDPDLSISRWLPLLWASGALALPLGWWFARLRGHAVGLFAVLLLGAVVAWSGSLEWRMLEAGFLRVADYWQSPRVGGLLLALVLMPLIAAMAASVFALHRRWRARAVFGGSAVILSLTLTLLLGSQSRTAVVAGAAGLLVMLLAAFLHRVDWRQWMGLAGIGVATLLTASLLANQFKPPGVSLNEEYLAPLQSVLLAAASEPRLAAAADAAVAGRLADWQAAWQVVGERPLAGWGRFVGLEGGPGSAPLNVESLYALMGLVGGLLAVCLFGLLMLSVITAIARVGHAGLWPMPQVIASHGIVGAVLVFLLLSPLVDAALSGILLNAVLALGVAAAVQHHQSSHSTT